MYRILYCRKLYSQLIFLVFFGFIAPNSGAVNNIPEIGDSTESIISLEQEKQIGKEFMRSVRYSLNLVNDPVSNEYIQWLGERLASQIDSRNRTYTFFIVNDPTINAFAGPGGYIGMHTGLILSTESEDELASVMAHEIAHVSQRHLVRSFEASSTLNIATMAAILAAILLGQSNPEISEAVIASTMAGTAQEQLSFSRTHEKEADRVGLEMMASAGFDPIAMPNFFEIMQKSLRYSGVSEIPEFVLTHPVTSSRIADTRGRAEQYPRVRRLPEQSMSYELVRARLNQITHNKETGENPLTPSQAPPQSSHYAKRYQQVLDLYSKQRYEIARSYIKQLIKDDTVRIPYIITQAEIELADKHPDRAVEILKYGITLYPNNTSMSLFFASALIKNNQAKQAMAVITEQIRATGPQLQLFNMQAEAAKQAGLKSEAYEALAEYHYLIGNIHASIKYFQQALDINKSNRFRELKLQARINELKLYVVNNQAAENESENEYAL